MTDMTGYIVQLRRLHKETMRQGREFEQAAEKWRLEAEAAYADAGAMKLEGRQRAVGEATRMLPQHERATDVRTNTFKAVQDAKGDFKLYMDISQTYAGLAQMKYAKAAAIMAEVLTWQSQPSS